jgi:Zn-dependent peptidase ImmA (M78 family)
VLCAKGHALILVEKDDESSERLFTIAHEVAHFVAHYLEPREKILERLGSGIKPVLDGERVASDSERIAGVLERCPIGFYHHMLPRAKAIADIESDADEIAFEVLSPLSEVLKNLKEKKQNTEEDIELLQRTFGLPAWAAKKRALLARSKLRGRHGKLLAGLKDFYDRT